MTPEGATPITRRENLQPGDVATFAYKGHEFTGAVWRNDLNDLVVGTGRVYLHSKSHFHEYFEFVSAYRPAPEREPLPTEPCAILATLDDNPDPEVLVGPVIDGDGYRHWRATYGAIAESRITSWTRLVPERDMPTDEELRVVLGPAVTRDMLDSIRALFSGTSPEQATDTKRLIETEAAHAEGYEKGYRDAEQATDRLPSAEELGWSRLGVAGMRQAQRILDFIRQWQRENGVQGGERA